MISGRRNVPLLESEILKAQSLSKTAMECARKLGVAYITYKKYAKMYGVFENCKSPNERSKRNPNDPESKPYPLSEILQNKHPNYEPRKILKKLILAGLKEDKCEICGYDEARIVDGKKPLILCFKDGNTKNHSLENLEVCCYNCAHNIHSGRIGRKLVKINL